MLSKDSLREKLFSNQVGEKGGTRIPTPFSTWSWVILVW